MEVRSKEDFHSVFWSVMSEQKTKVNGTDIWAVRDGSNYCLSVIGRERERERERERAREWEGEGYWKGRKA